MYIGKGKSIIIQLFFARKICVCHKSSVCTIARIARIGTFLDYFPLKFLNTLKVSDIVTILRDIIFKKRLVAFSCITMQG